MSQYTVVVFYVILWLFVNLLLSLISKLSLILGVSAQENKHMCAFMPTHIALLVDSGNYLKVLEPVFQGKGYSCN